jgi:uncharacterized protein (UPF0210 family)
MSLSPLHPTLAVRAVTTFVVLDPGPAGWLSVLSPAISTIATLAATLRANEGCGYTVQTLRVITNPFSEYLDTSTSIAALADLKSLKQAIATIEHDNAELLSGTRIRFSIGAATTLNDLKLVPALIRDAGDLANTCINIPCDNGIVDAALVHEACAVCAELGQTTPRGEGNFNFTINFNGPKLCPYFPAGFNTREAGFSFVIGLEYPSLLVDILEKMVPEGACSIVTSAAGRGGAWAAAAAAITDEVNRHLVAITGHARAAEASTNFAFAGVDSSPAPSKSVASMCRVIELLGVPHFGASGTVEACAFLTRIFKSLGEGGVPLVGFSGLMFAALEDTGLASAAAKEQYSITDLLTYSSVCGIGLDTVPIPGDTPKEKMAQLACDCGTMAFRLKKPLTVRLFPVPGLREGDMTMFESEDLCNCRVFKVP